MRISHQQRRASLGSKLLSLRPKIGSSDASTTTESIVSSKYLSTKAANSQPCQSETMLDRKSFAPKYNIRIFRKTSNDNDKPCRKPVVESDVETVDSTSASWGGDTHEGNENSAGVMMANAFFQREQLRRFNSSGERLEFPESPSRKKVTFAEELDDSSLSTASPPVERRASGINNNEYSAIPRSPRRPTVRDENKVVYVAEFEASKRSSSSDNFGGCNQIEKVSRPPPSRQKVTIDPDNKVNIPPPPFLQRKNTDNSTVKSKVPPPPPIQKRNTGGSNRNTNSSVQTPPRTHNSISGTTVRPSGNIPEFDKTYGRCINHPAILIAVKAPFRKSGWSVIRQNCPLCDNALQNNELSHEDDAGKGNGFHTHDVQPQMITQSRSRDHGSVTGSCPDVQAKETAQSRARTHGRVNRRSCHNAQSNQVSLSRARVHGNTKHQNLEGKLQREVSRHSRGSIVSVVEPGRASDLVHGHFGLVPYRSSMPSLCNEYRHCDKSYGEQNAKYRNAFISTPCVNENAPLDACENKGSRSNLTQSPIGRRQNYVVGSHNQTWDHLQPAYNYPAPSGHIRHEPSRIDAVVVTAMPWKSLMGAGEYTGDVNKNGVPAGRGRIVFDNGNVYEGCWMDGNPQEIAESLALIKETSS